MKVITSTGKIIKDIWEGQPQYKQERLSFYLGLLKKNISIPSNDYPILLAQLIIENGALDPDVVGDHGCSGGLIQYNSCSHHKLKWLKFVEKYPDWNNWQYQIQQMAIMVGDRYKIYHGNIEQVIVHHNSPALARKSENQTNTKYYKKALQRSLSLSSL